MILVQKEINHYHKVFSIKIDILNGISFILDIHLISDKHKLIYGGLKLIIFKI